MGTPESRLHRLRQRGQGNIVQSPNEDNIHQGQPAHPKVYLGGGFKSVPKTPTKCCRKWCSLLSGWVSAVF